jgi:NAD(P)-dependent dehydrogenase (short-subunit alcohol dehydrogenase family)
MNKQPWALILGASSGFGEATAIELARAGMNIFGVHLDRRDKLPRVEEIRNRIDALGRDTQFFNCNASDDEMRQDTMEKIRQRLSEPPGTLRVLMHSLAWGSLKPLVGAEQVVSKKQLEITADTMGHSLVYWVQDCLRAGLLEAGARIFAMTSSGGTRVLPNYGPVSAAKAILESHIRQLALELAPAGITANAILAGVTETPALQAIPGHEKLAEIAKLRNPHHRLTTPEDVARCIAALCHPATYWMTGNTLHVDGGENIVG